MNVGDKVKDGTISGMLLGSLYAKMLNHVHMEHLVTDWDNKFPYWKEYMVYYIVFDKPVKPLSFSEFAELRDWKTAKDLEKLREEYEDVPDLFFCALPEEGMEHLL